MKDCPDHQLHRHMLLRQESEAADTAKRVEDLCLEHKKLEESTECMSHRISSAEERLEKLESAPAARAETWRAALIAAGTSAVVSSILKNAGEF